MNNSHNSEFYIYLICLFLLLGQYFFQGTKIRCSFNTKFYYTNRYRLKKLTKNLVTRETNMKISYRFFAGSGRLKR